MLTQFLMCPVFICPAVFGSRPGLSICRDPDRIIAKHVIDSSLGHKRATSQISSKSEHSFMSSVGKGRYKRKHADGDSYNRSRALHYIYVKRLGSILGKSSLLVYI